VWVRPPSTYDQHGGRWTLSDSFRDGSQQRIEDEVNRLEAQHPGVVSTLDLRSWFDAGPLASDHDARPDGLHLTVTAATKVVEDWLGPQLVAISRTG